MTTGEVAASRSKNVRHAANSWSDAISTSTPSSARSAGLDPGGLRRIGHVVRDGLGDPCARRRLVVGLDEAGPPADHLAQRPERDPVAVGGAPPGVPPDGVDEAVEVLEELPREAGLPDPARSDHAHEAGPALAARRLEQVLELAELLVPADERRLERVAPVPPAALGDHADGAPRRDRRRLALERLLAGVLEHDRARCRPRGRLAHEDGPGGRGGLEPRGGVDDVARDHALVRRADRDRRLAGQDAGPRLDPGAERADRIHELEPRPHGPLGVVLAGDRARPRPPSPRRR